VGTGADRVNVIEQAGFSDFDTTSNLPPLLLSPPTQRLRGPRPPPMSYLRRPTEAFLAAAITARLLTGCASSVAGLPHANAASRPESVDQDPRQLERARIETGATTAPVDQALQFFAGSPPDARPEQRAAAPSIPIVPPELPARIVRVGSSPQGAMVYRDEQLLGRTPLTVRVPAGNVWILRIRHPGYVPQWEAVPGRSDRMLVRLRRTPPPPAAQDESHPTRSPPTRWRCGRELLTHPCDERVFR